MNEYLMKLALYSSFLGVPIFMVKIDNVLYYFVAYDSVDYNPSNHKHFIELRRCKNINAIMNHPVDFDGGVLQYKLTELPDISFSFPAHLEWFKIK